MTESENMKLITKQGDLLRDLNQELESRDVLLAESMLIIDEQKRITDKLDNENTELTNAIRAVLRYISSHQVYEKDAKGVLERALGTERVDLNAEQ